MLPQKETAHFSFTIGNEGRDGSKVLELTTTHEGYVWGNTVVIAPHVPIASAIFYYIGKELEFISVMADG